MIICNIRAKEVCRSRSAHTYTIHQNFVLMLKSAQIEERYQDLIPIIACEINNKDCMLQQCENCPLEMTL